MNVCTTFGTIVTTHMGIMFLGLVVGALTVVLTRRKG